MSEEFIHIAEKEQRIGQPLTHAHLLRLGALCGVNAGTRVLDLACGRGELLAQWARAYDLQGTGVDEDEACIEAAQQRVNELEVWSQVQFVESDVLAFPQPFHQYNVVACLNATWMPVDTVTLITILREAIRKAEGGLLLLGQTFWQKLPPPDVCAAMGVARHDLPLLGDLVAHFEAADVDLNEMLIVTVEDRDTFYAQQWRAVQAWLHQHRQSPLAADLRHWLRQTQRQYLQYEREYLGWGAFILAVPGDASAPAQAATQAAPSEDAHWAWEAPWQISDPAGDPE